MKKFHWGALLLPWFLLGKALALSVELSDSYCINFIIHAFHAQVQLGQGGKFDIQQACLENCIPSLPCVESLCARWKMPLLINYRGVTAQELEGWQIRPLRAVTGLLWKSGKEVDQEDKEKYGDLIGLFAVNKNLKKIVIAFRGSQNFSEWLGNNLNVLTSTPDQGGIGLEGIEVHRGYWNIAEQLLCELNSELHLHFNSVPSEEVGSYEINFTGHSLGGAVAVLTATAMARWLHKRFFSREDESPGRRVKIALRTFGAPPVGKEGLKATVLDLIAEGILTYKRFVRDCDPIPQGFGYSWVLGYEHPIEALVLASSKSEQECDDCMVKQHDIGTYQQKIFKALNLEVSVPALISRSCVQ
jgi:hypothetical protein